MVYQRCDSRIYWAWAIISSRWHRRFDPDMQISRIRLSDKTSRLHPRHVVPKRSQAEHSRADCSIGDLARDHRDGAEVEPYAAWMGQLLPGRHIQPRISGPRQLHSRAVAPVVALQA